MSTFTERLALLITADGKGAVRELEKVGVAADRNLSRTEDKVHRLSGGLTKFGTTAVVSGAIAGVGLFKAADAASELNEQTQQAQQVFGPAAKEVERFAETAAVRFGQSRREAIQGANGFATFGKAAGLEGPELAAFSNRLVGLTGDLASFKDTATSDVQRSLLSGLSGEIEPLRRLGIVLNDDAVKAEAVRMGLARTTQEVTEQQKILARTSLIFSSTVAQDAMGDFVRTSDEMANSIRTAKAEWENAKAAFGESSKPIFTDLVQGGTKALQIFNAMPSGAQGAVGGLATVATGAALTTGAVSLLGGQLLKLRGVYNTVRTMSVASAAAAAGPWLAAAAAIGTAVGVISWANEQTEKNWAMRAPTEGTVPRAFDPANPSAMQQSTTSTAARLAGIASNRRPTSWWNEMKSWVGLYDGAENATNELTRATAELNTQLDQIPASAAGQWIDRLRPALVAAGMSAEDVDLVIGGLKRRLSDRQAEERAAAAMSGLGDAAKGAGADLASAAADVDRWGFAIERAADGTEKARTKFEEYADGVRRSVDPLMAVSDATRGLESANRNLIRTQRDLNEARREAATGSEEAMRRIAQAERDLYRAQNRRQTADYSDLDSRRDVLDAQARLREAHEDLAKSRRDAADRVRDLEFDLADARANVVKAGIEQNLAMVALADAIAKNPQLVSNAIGVLRELTAQGLIDPVTAGMFEAFWTRAASKVGETEAAVDRLNGKLDQLNGKKVEITIEQNVTTKWQDTPMSRTRNEPDALGRYPYGLPYSKTDEGRIVSYQPTGTMDRWRSGGASGGSSWTDRRNSAVDQAYAKGQPDLGAQIFRMSEEEFLRWERFISGGGTRRAGGGDVYAGDLVRVNERGLEGFRPAGSGTVIPLTVPSNATKGSDGASLSGMTDQRDQSVHVTFARGAIVTSDPLRAALSASKHVRRVVTRRDRHARTGR